MNSREREHAFLVGAPLAVVPALAFLPAVVFLLFFPRFPGLRWLGYVLAPALALTSGLGLWKLALCAVQKPWGIFNALSFGALLVLLVIAAYTGLLLALMTLRL